MGRDIAIRRKYEKATLVNPIKKEIHGVCPSRIRNTPIRRGDTVIKIDWGHNIQCLVEDLRGTHRIYEKRSDYSEENSQVFT